MKHYETTWACRKIVPTFFFVTSIKIDFLSPVRNISWGGLKTLFKPNNHLKFQNASQTQTLSFSTSTVLTSILYSVYLKLLQNARGILVISCTLHAHTRPLAHIHSCMHTHFIQHYHISDSRKIKIITRLRNKRHVRDKNINFTCQYGTSVVILCVWYGMYGASRPVLHSKIHLSIQ